MSVDSVGCKMKKEPLFQIRGLRRLILIVLGLGTAMTVLYFLSPRFANHKLTLYYPESETYTVTIERSIEDKDLPIYGFTAAQVRAFTFKSIFKDPVESKEVAVVDKPTIFGFRFAVNMKFMPGSKSTVMVFSAKEHAVGEIVKIRHYSTYCFYGHFEPVSGPNGPEIFFVEKMP